MTEPIRWAVPAASAVVVVPEWDTGTEAEVAIRSLAGVLALHHRVEVLVRSGGGGPPRRDGALEVVDLAARPPDTATRAVVGEALRAALVAGGLVPDRLPEPAATVLGVPAAAAWQAALAHLAGRHPDVVVLAGPLGDGALDLVAALPRDTTTAALPLAPHGRPLDGDTLALLRSVGTVLATSPTEAARLADAGVDAVDVGTHLPANPYAVREPPAMLAAGEYVAVVDAVTAVGDSAMAHDRGGRRYGPSVDTGAWLQGALAPVPVAAVDGPDIVTWDRGHGQQHTVVTSRSDLWRVLSHARAVVVVDPDPVLARSTVEALLHGTPVVVPAGTLAAGHARQSAGGLVVSDRGELLAAVRALMDDEQAAATLGRAGQQWALARFGDLDGYRRRVGDALGVPTGGDGAAGGSSPADTAPAGQAAAR